MNGRDIALGLLAALIWGATFPVTRAALDETPPLLFAALRFIAAAAFIVIVPRPAVSWRWLLLAGLLLGVGQYGFLFVAMANGVATGLASLLIHTQALFTVLIAWPAFAERPRRRQWLALGLTVLGLGVLVLDRASPVGLSGLVLILCGALAAGFGNNVLKRFGTADRIGVAVWMSVAAPLPLLLLSLVFDSGGLHENLGRVGWATLGAIAYSALLATIVAYAVWGRLLARYPASAVAPFFLLVPVFGIGLSAWLLGEMLSGLRLLGCGLIFTGLLLTVVARKRF